MRKFNVQYAKQTIPLSEITSALRNLQHNSTWSDPVGKFLLKRLLAFYRSPNSHWVAPSVFVQDLRLIVDAFSTAAFTPEMLLHWYAEDKNVLEKDLKSVLPPRPLADQSAFGLVQQMRGAFPEWFVEKINERFRPLMH